MLPLTPAFWHGPFVSVHANGQGLETDTPYVQVGELFFKGKWSEMIGTEIIVGPDKENGGIPIDLFGANGRSKGNRNGKEETCLGENYGGGKEGMSSAVIH
jgi:hypothetical protein